MNKSNNTNIYTFNSQKESFLNFSIVLWQIILPLAVIVDVYKNNMQYFYILLIFSVLLIALLTTFPSSYKHLYYRWIIFQYNKNTTLIVDVEQKHFTYQHNDKIISFVSDDIEKWSWHNFEAWNVNFVKIVRIKLKNGEKINISSGIGDVEEFLQENQEQLSLPKGKYRYGDDFNSLRAYIESIQKQQ